MFAIQMSRRVLKETAPEIFWDGSQWTDNADRAKQFPSRESATNHGLERIHVHFWDVTTVPSP